jgi:hypothetical protein
MVVFLSLGNHFSSVLERFVIHIYLLLYLGEYLKEGELVIGDIVSWRVKYLIKDEGSHLMSLASENM